MTRTLVLALLAAMLALAGRGESLGEKASATDKSGAPPALELTTSQQLAVGVRSDHPQAIRTPASLEAFGVVLDPVALVSDSGRAASARAAAEAAAADLARLEKLYRDEANASLKAVQAARAVASEAAERSRAAAAAFRLQWAPIDAMSAERRAALVEKAARGRTLLMRADVPSRRVQSAIGARALVEVDAIHVEARVLGPLPTTESASQGSGWLLEIAQGPQGLGPGARARVLLQSAPAEGLLVPAAALLYAEHGAYVYREVARRDAGRIEYATVPVKLLTPVGAGWLVSGLDRDDRIVVEGAGVLWSLQGVSSFSAAEEEHD